VSSEGKKVRETALGAPRGETKEGEGGGPGAGAEVPLQPWRGPWRHRDPHCGL